MFCASAALASSMANDSSPGILPVTPANPPGMFVPDRSKYSAFIAFSTEEIVKGSLIVILELDVTPSKVTFGPAGGSF